MYEVGGIIKETKLGLFPNLNDLLPKLRNWSKTCSWTLRNAQKNNQLLIKYRIMVSPFFQVIVLFFLGIQDHVIILGNLPLELLSCWKLCIHSAVRLNQPIKLVEHISGIWLVELYSITSSRLLWRLISLVVLMIQLADIKFFFIHIPPHIGSIKRQVAN